MFILFDTNVWISQLGLQSKNGQPVRHFARRQNATVAIPEIVQLEVEEKLIERLLKFKKQIEDGHNQLLPLLGKLQSINLPSEEKIRKTVAGIIPDFDVPTRRIPFNIDAARSSMIKLLRKIPPSSKTEQFRDGVIWHHCLELLDEDDVYLVSEDKDFYHDRDYTKGLAGELVKEMQQRSKTQKVKLIQNLTQLLDEIRMPTELDTVQLFNSVKVKEGEIIEELLSSNGFKLFDRVEGEINCFATEEAHKLYFTFSLVHPCQDITGAGRRNGELKLKGTGFLNPETEKISEAQLLHILLDYPDWEVGGAARGIAFVSAHINAPKVHRIRFPLGPPEYRARRFMPNDV